MAGHGAMAASCTPGLLVVEARDVSAMQTAPTLIPRQPHPGLVRSTSTHARAVRHNRRRGCAVAATVAAIALLSLVPSTGACFIQGQDSGECQEPEEFKADMEFCGSEVRYRACVPKENPLWPKHDVFNKDKWVADTYKAIVDERIRHETNETLDDLGITEVGEEGDIVVRFFEEEDCVDSYKKYFCWLNFPRCDEEDESLIMCKSVCENFFRACKYDTDLHRCGNPLFFGGEEAEKDDILDEDGTPIYWRTSWPGQPFREYQADDEDNPIVVCTPSLKDAASGIVPSRVVLLAAILCIWALAVLVTRS